MRTLAYDPGRAASRRPVSSSTRSSSSSSRAARPRAPRASAATCRTSSPRSSPMSCSSVEPRSKIRVRRPRRIGRAAPSRGRASHDGRSGSHTGRHPRQDFCATRGHGGDRGHRGARRRTRDDASGYGRRARAELQARPPQGSRTRPSAGPRRRGCATRAARRASAGSRAQAAARDPHVVTDGASGQDALARLGRPGDAARGVRGHPHHSDVV